MITPISKSSPVVTMLSFFVKFRCIVRDDDLIFEDFARLRLKGHDPEEAEA